MEYSIEMRPIGILPLVFILIGCSSVPKQTASNEKTIRNPAAEGASGDLSKAFQGCLNELSGNTATFEGFEPSFIFFKSYATGTFVLCRGVAANNLYETIERLGLQTKKVAFKDKDGNSTIFLGLSNNDTGSRCTSTIDQAQLSQTRVCAIKLDLFESISKHLK